MWCPYITKKKKNQCFWEFFKTSMINVDILTAYKQGMEKAMATHSSTLAWKIPWTEKPGRLWFKGSKELDMTVAPHSSTLAWKIPWVEEPGGLQSMGSGRVGHDWATSLSLFTFMHWRRKWQPTLVFLPGESQGRGILVGCRLWGRTGSDMTEAT